MKYSKEESYIDRYMYYNDTEIVVHYRFYLKLNDNERIQLSCFCYRKGFSTLWVRCLNKEIKIDKLDNFYLATLLTYKLKNYIVRKIHDYQLLD